MRRLALVIMVAADASVGGFVFSDNALGYMYPVPTFSL